MPTLIQGFGSAFIGQRDFRADGSFLTTEWACFLIPLLPVESVRVVKAGTKAFPGGSETQYRILERHRPDRKQVLSTYGFMACYAAWVIVAGLEFFVHLAGPLLARSENLFTGALVALLLVPPWIVPFALRMRARRRARMTRPIGAGKRATR